MESFLSDYLPSTYLHTDQKKLSEYLLSEKNVIASAPMALCKSIFVPQSLSISTKENCNTFFAHLP